MRLTDSCSELRFLLAKQPLGTLLYYLDAHWQENLPLQEEIKLILAYGQPAAIMIDDFAVPGDPDYGYDDYGPGKTLSLSLLAQIEPRGAALFSRRCQHPRRPGRGAVVRSLLLVKPSSRCLISCLVSCLTNGLK